MRSKNFIIFLLAHVRDILYINNTIFFSQNLLTSRPRMLYYYRDHKVGVVGVLCPFLRKGRSVSLLPIKCVGAKCTKRCCRSAAAVLCRASGFPFAAKLTAAALSKTALCTLYSAHGQFVKPSAKAESEIYERGTVRQKCFYRSRCVSAVWRFS